MGYWFKRSPRSTTSSEFSVFVREARSGEKKRVFKQVLNDSIDAQDRIMKDAGERRSAKTAS